MPSEISPSPKTVYRRVRERCVETLEGIFDAVTNRLLTFSVGAAAVKQAAIIQEQNTEVMAAAFETTIEATRHAKSIATEGDETERALLEMFIGGVLAQSKAVTQMIQAGAPGNAEEAVALERPTSSFASLPAPSANAGKRQEQSPLINSLANPANKTEPTPVPEGAPPPPVKRKRGRPEGSKNKPKTSRTHPKDSQPRG